MRLHPTVLVFCCATITCLACAAGALEEAVGAGASSEAFQRYWYRGQAELSRYELQQSRYGETHRGDAVLIFVTEDFLPDKQVKYEGGTPSSTPRSVLKLNFTRKFNTGIYPYSMMMSVFTPVGREDRALKVTSSVQEWCGQTYEQLNLRDGAYRGVLHSYFQDEADRELELEPAVLEDEIWTRIRIDPTALPLGEVRLIPGLQSARLQHRPSRVERARASLAQEGAGLRVYRIEYRDFPRTLEIRFEQESPHAIVSWQESSGAVKGVPRFDTRAERTHTMMTDYWNKNSVDDAKYRAQLGLD